MSYHGGEVIVDPDEVYEFSLMRLHDASRVMVVQLYMHLRLKTRKKGEDRCRNNLAGCLVSQ